MTHLARYYVYKIHRLIFSAGLEIVTVQHEKSGAIRHEASVTFKCR